MRKRILMLTAVTAALTLSTGITAFAGTWKEDSWGRYYENDDGTRPVYGGWFTDPADGGVYAMDPDGYVMRNSEMGSFRTDDNGRRIEKTEAELQAEAERRAYLATRPSPAKSQAAADVAADAVKAGTTEYATGTMRTTYQAEMEQFSFQIIKEALDKRTNTTILPAEQKDNLEIMYGLTNPDGYQFLTTIIWRNGNTSSTEYKEHAYEMSYHFDSASFDTGNYDEAYRKLVVAALGTNAGQAEVDAIQAERENGVTSFNHNGTTDTGNSYQVKYLNNLVTIYVTVSGVDPTASTETAEEAPAEETAETPAEETVVTSSVIVAGQSV